MASQLKYEVISLDQVPLATRRFLDNFSNARRREVVVLVLVVDDERIIADTLS